MSAIKGPLEITSIRERCKELRAKIEGIEEMRYELMLLNSVAALIERAERLLAGEVTPECRSGTLFGRRATLRTVDIIEDAWGGDGELHVLEVLKRITATGWCGSGDPQKDYKNIFQNMTSKPHRFRNVGRAKFVRVEKERG